MKIYTWIETEEEFASFVGFLSAHNLHRAEYFTPLMYYWIDNETCDVDVIAGNKIPAGYLIKWDPVYIGKMYRNEIIGRFNQDKLQWTQLDFEALEPMVQVLMYGSKKYDTRNWAKACPNRLDLLDSLSRHFIKLVQGESIDSESNLPHIGHLMCNAMFYSYWEQKTNGQFENADKQ